MSIYRGTRKIAGSNGSPYIDNNGEWAVLGHPLGVRAESKKFKITISNSNWTTRYTDGKEGYHTVEIPISDLLENDRVIMLKIAGDTIPDIITSSENLNGVIVGHLLQDGNIIILQKGEEPIGDVVIDVVIASVVETEVES